MTWTKPDAPPDSLFLLGGTLLPKAGTNGEEEQLGCQSLTAGTFLRPALGEALRLNQDKEVLCQPLGTKDSLWPETGCQRSHSSFSFGTKPDNGDRRVPARRLVFLLCNCALLKTIMVQSMTDP